MYYTDQSLSGMGRGAGARHDRRQVFLPLCPMCRERHGRRVRTLSYSPALSCLAVLYFSCSIRLEGLALRPPCSLTHATVGCSAEGATAGTDLPREGSTPLFGCPPPNAFVRLFCCPRVFRPLVSLSPPPPMGGGCRAACLHVCRVLSRGRRPGLPRLSLSLPLPTPFPLGY